MKRQVDWLVNGPLTGPIFSRALNQLTQLEIFPARDKDWPVNECNRDISTTEKALYTSGLKEHLSKPGAVVNKLDPVHIQRAIQRLRSTPAKRPIFGADRHRFVLNPPLAETEVLAFERQHRISLPADYRKFVIAVGNGGAGPYYGVFPLGQMDANSGVKPWHENDGFVGVLSEPFLLGSDWNDLTGMPSDDLLQQDEAEYERQLDEFDKRYWRASLVNGALPICHEGCALRIWLVVTGEQAGHVWHDGRSDYKGLKPVVTAAGTPATFSLWYNEWLHHALRAVTSYS